MFLSEIFTPKAKRIFRFVPILQGLPSSIRERVRVEMFDFLANSALLIIKDSLISFNEFALILSPLFSLISYPIGGKIRFE